MKILAPTGTSGVSIAGEIIEIAADGTCDVSATAARELCDSHGFTIPGQKQAEKAKLPADKFDDMSRAEVIGYIKSKGLPVTPSSDTEVLKAQARTQYSAEERAADLAAKRAN